MCRQSPTNWRSGSSRKRVGRSASRGCPMPDGADRRRRRDRSPVPSGGPASAALRTHGRLAMHRRLPQGFHGSANVAEASCCRTSSRGGRIGRGPEAELVERYMKRVDLAQKISSSTPKAVRLPHLSAVAPCCSTKAANRCQSLLNSPNCWKNGATAAYARHRSCLGAADGFTPDEREGADKVIAFGRATWPHLMARAMLAGATRRATSIAAGHPTSTARVATEGRSACRRWPAAIAGGGHGAGAERRFRSCRDRGARAPAAADRQGPVGRGAAAKACLKRRRRARRGRLAEGAQRCLAGYGSSRPRPIPTR